MSNWGQIILVGALCFACLQSILPLYGYWRKNPYLLAFARPSAYAQCVSLIVAYLLLTIAFAMNDFSLIYVAENSHPDLPLMYRLTALWGAHEGSILLWILILSIWTILFSFFSKHLRRETYNLTLAILGLMNACFLIFLLFTSNPFLKATQLLEGHDLNPLLQDPGFVIHPPMLYIGYVGFAVSFAITQSALICNQLDVNWARVTRTFCLAAFSFLTLGISLGSWWAYRVLGWGGFWFWDPVENASLLPWLSGTALIHVLILVEKRNHAKNWAVLLAFITFSLSLLGTFLVRSGVLISAHTFANDPSRGVFLLILLAIMILVSLLIYCIYIPKPSSTKAPHFVMLSKETSLLLNSALLTLAMLTVLLGTLYPLIFDALHLGAISVGAPYFNQVMLPLVFFTMLLIALGPLCHWQTQPFYLLWKHVWKKIILSIIISIILLWTVHQHFNVIAFITLTLSFLVILTMLPFRSTQLGMTFAHIGFAVLAIGVILSSTLNKERDVRMHPGNAIRIGPYQFFFLDMQSIKANNYRGVRTNFEVLKGKHHVTNLYPEKRIYTVRNMVMTKVDIHPGIFRDLYIALGEPLNKNDWSVRIYYKPFMRFIWLGGVMMMLGGFIAILKRGKQKP